MSKTICVFLIVLLGVFGFAQAQESTAGPDIFSGDLALEHVANQVSVGPRPVGSPEIIMAGNIILDYLDQLGWETSEQWYVINFGSSGTWDEASQETLKHWNLLDFDTLIDGYLADQGYETDREQQFVDFDQVLVPVRNLVASYGSGSKTIIIGAHYDSRIFSDKDPNPENHTVNVPGANDGGSGVGVLLELARVLSEYYSTDDYEIRLVFFDAEDNGRISPWTQVPWAENSSGYLVGSIIYASTLDLDAENIEYMILVDMVGDMDQSLPIEGYSNNIAPELTAAIWQTAADLGYEDHFISEVRGAITDDHLPFVSRGIPSVDIIDLDYPYWHTIGDTLDKVSPESLERVGRVLQTYLENTGVIVKNADD